MISAWTLRKGAEAARPHCRLRLCPEMSRLLLAILGLGLLASVSPSTLLAFVALLASRKRKRNATAFLVGWNVSLIVVFTVCYGAGKTTISTLHTDAHAATCIVEAVLGVVFIGLAGRKWWRRRHQEKLWQALQGALRGLGQSAPLASSATRRAGATLDAHGIGRGGRCVAQGGSAGGVPGLSPLQRPLDCRRDHHLRVLRPPPRRGHLRPGHQLTNRGVLLRNRGAQRATWARPRRRPLPQPAGAVRDPP